MKFSELQPGELYTVKQAARALRTNAKKIRAAYELGQIKARDYRLPGRKKHDLRILGRDIMTFGLATGAAFIGLDEAKPSGNPTMLPLVPESITDSPPVGAILFEHTGHMSGGTTCKSKRRAVKNNEPAKRSARAIAAAARTGFRLSGGHADTPTAKEA